MKKLQIIIPHYKEKWEEVKPLFDSINLQQNVDFDEIGVIVVNDGDEEVFDEKIFDNYKFHTDYYVAPHRGVSATRNYGLDKATAEYVMFCDCDDMFVNNIGLWFVMREMNGEGFDSLVSVFMEESVHPQTKEHFYIERGRLEQGGIDSTFVHGKIQRRQYLINNNIRWDDSLTIHEDSRFNCLCQRLADPQRIKYCPFPFYLWKWRDESVCRHDPKYILKTLPNMVASNTSLVEEFLKRSRKDDAKFYVTSMVMDCYYSINCKQWMAEENKEFKDKLELCFKEYFAKYKDLFESVDEQIKGQIVSGVRNRFAMEGLILESITFEDWLKHIEEL